jgi:YD repeat-containing protein
MVAIFTGQGSGLQKGSGAVLGAAGLLGSAGLGRSGGNVFVNAANGNLVLEQRDAILVGRGTDVDAGRSYNRSIDLLDRGGITQNWRFNQKRIDTTLALDLPGATLKLIDVDGAATTYTWDGAGYVSTDGAGAYDRFTRSLEGWTRTDGDTQVQEKYFDRHLLYGLLTQVVDPSGNTTNYTYTTLGRIARITTADGGYVEYGYDGLDEKVRTVRLGYTDLATGAAKTQTIAYTYAGENLATATIDLSPEDGSTADGTIYTQSYAYNGDGALTSVTETDGSRLDIGYDDMGRVVSLAETVAAGATRTTTLAYAAGATTITDAAGQATTLRYNADGTLASITAPPATAGAAAQTTSFTYTVRGDVESVTDPAGHVTRYTYDDRGNVLTATDRLGNVVRRSWDARNQLIAETRTGADQSAAAAEHTDRYVYDAATRLRFTISATGDVTEQRYNAFGQAVLALRYTADRYDLSGLSPSTAPSEAQMEAWVAARPDQTAVQQTAFAYDARGNLLQEASHAAFSTQGSPSTAEGSRRIAYVHDQAGRLVQRTETGRNTEQFVYDGLGRLTASVDVHGGRTSIVFDDPATQTIVTLANGLVQTSTYDKTGALVAYTEAGELMPTGTTTYLYDPVGRPRVVTDANGIKRYALYDKVGRTVADVSQAGELTEYRYDADDRLIATTRYATLLSPAALASVADPASPVEMAAIRPAGAAADQWTWMVYDAEDRLIQTIDGSGSVVTNVYDASGQLVQTTESRGRLTAAQLQGFRTNPPTTPMQPGSSTLDRVTRLFYDTAGLLVGRMDGEGYLTTMVYDAAGQKVAETSYLNPTRTSERAAGTLDTLLASFFRNAGDRTMRYVYDAQGLLRFAIDPQGHVVETAYQPESRSPGSGDAAGAIGRIVTAYAKALPSLASYTMASVRSALAAGDASLNRTSFEVYDAAGRVAYAIAADGAVENYRYDVMGAVVATTRYAARRATTNLPAKADMDAWASANASSASDRVTRTFYDDGGRPRYVVDAEGYVSRTDYDAGGRMIAMLRFANPVAVTDATTAASLDAAGGSFVAMTWAYDVLDRIVAMTDANGIVHAYTYYANGLMEFDVRASGSADESRMRFEYDGAGRRTATFMAWGRPEQIVTRATFTAFGDIATETDALGRVTSFTYNRRGETISRTDAAGGVMAFAYNAFGEQVRMTDARGNASYRYYDTDGQLVAERDAEDYVTQSRASSRRSTARSRPAPACRRRPRPARARRAGRPRRHGTGRRRPAPASRRRRARPARYSQARSSPRPRRSRSPSRPPRFRARPTPPARRRRRAVATRCPRRSARHPRRSRACRRATAGSARRGRAAR